MISNEDEGCNVGVCVSNSSPKTSFKKLFSKCLALTTEVLSKPWLLLCEATHSCWVWTRGSRFARGRVVQQTGILLPTDGRSKTLWSSQPVGASTLPGMHSD